MEIPLKKLEPNNANNNCRFCLRIFEDMEERVGITQQLINEFRNITQTEVKMQTKNFHCRIWAKICSQTWIKKALELQPMSIYTYKSRYLVYLYKIVTIR